MEYRGIVTDEERALYGIKDSSVVNCTFSGPADGESALKECRNITVSDCEFVLRYPLWHVEGAYIEKIRMPETCRAALWYDKDIKIVDSEMHGIKALRECSDIVLKNDHIVSPEFGWRCHNLDIDGCDITAEYLFFENDNLKINNLKLKGKYSFQYVKNMTITDSVLDTKDAFWHSENVTVMDSIVKGEYLAWYSKNLKLIRCKIIGTQPLCYADGLVLEDCEMEGTDFSFEYSDVNATVKGDILSVKNPKAGRIEADSIGEVILDAHQMEGSSCEIITK